MSKMSPVARTARPEDEKPGFKGIFVHPKTIPDLKAGYYLIGIGKLPTDKEDYLMMMRFEGLQDGSGPTGIYGATAESVQSQAHKLLGKYNDLLARGVSSRDALAEIMRGIQQAQPPA